MLIAVGIALNVAIIVSFAMWLDYAKRRVPLVIAGMGISVLGVVLVGIYLI
jgi:hypothetical protein